MRDSRSLRGRTQVDASRASLLHGFVGAIVTRILAIAAHRHGYGPPGWGAMAYSYSIAAQPLVGNIIDAIEGIVARVPASRERAVDAPATAARTLARKAAARAAVLSGALALPPGVLGMLTV